MPVETGDEIQDLNPDWPAGTEPKSQGDDHLRKIKQCLKNSFPNMNGAWSTTSPIKAGQATLSTELVRLDQVPKTALGWIDAAGAPVSGNTNWSSARLSQGVYQITFNDSAGALYNQVMNANAFSGVAVNAIVRLDAVNQMSVILTNSGNPIDALVNFRREII
jgi:hypothetical protein